MDNNSISVETFNRNAKAYMERFMNLELYTDTYDLLLNYLDFENATILETACGPGNITRYILDKNPSLKIDASDLSPNMVELAKQNVPEANIYLMDARDLSKIETKYNAIVCGFCMPYLSKKECEKMISDAADLLFQGGLFYFSCMEGGEDKSGNTFSSNGVDQVYIYYHQEDYLKEALESNGFNLINLIRKEFKRDNGDVFHDMIFISRKSLT